MDSFKPLQTEAVFLNNFTRYRSFKNIVQSGQYHWQVLTVIIILDNTCIAYAVSMLNEAYSHFGMKKIFKL